MAQRIVVVIYSDEEETAPGEWTLRIDHTGVSPLEATKMLEEAVDLLDERRVYVFEPDEDEEEDLEL